MEVHIIITSQVDQHFELLFYSFNKYTKFISSEQLHIPNIDKETKNLATFKLKK